MYKKIIMLLLLMMFTSCGVSNKNVFKNNKISEIKIPDGFEYRKFTNLENVKKINLPVSGTGNIVLSKIENETVHSKGFLISKEFGEDKLPWINYDNAQLLILRNRFTGEVKEQYEKLEENYTLIPKAFQDSAEKNYNIIQNNKYNVANFSSVFERKSKRGNRFRFNYGYIIKSGNKSLIIAVIGLKTNYLHIKDHKRRLQKAFDYVIQTIDF